MASTKGPSPRLTSLKVLSEGNDPDQPSYSERRYTAREHCGAHPQHCDPKGSQTQSTATCKALSL